MEAPVVLLHGFSNEQALAIMRAAKKAASEAGLEPGSIAFAMTTPTNVEWKVSELLSEVSEEHEHMRKNPPGAPPGGQRMA
jgi:hypothetical protein